MEVNANFPYPVITPVRNDFNNMGSFHADISFDKASNVLNVKCVLTNETIKNCIDKDYMQYLVIISCSQSRYRSALQQKENLFMINLDPNVLNKNVTIQAFIVVKKEIHNFDTSHLSKIYNGINLSYEIGNYVAISDKYNLKIDFGNTSKSFIKINKNDNVKDIEVNVDESKILVTLSPKNFQNYDNYRNDKNYNNIISYNIIISSITSAIYQIINDDEVNSEDYAWLEAMLDTADMSLENIIDSPGEVQKLITTVFKNPVARLFDSLDNLSDNEEYDYE